MHKVTSIYAGISVCAAILLSTCTSTYGSVSPESVAEALRAGQLAITPVMPGWLLERGQIRRLPDEQTKRVCEILLPTKVRSVGEEFYRDVSQGNRNDDSTQVFYLYSASGQSLGGRIIGKKALMDDFNLTDAECEELYTIFHPYLRGITTDPYPHRSR